VDQVRWWFVGFRNGDILSGLQGVGEISKYQNTAEKLSEADLSVAREIWKSSS
jgi:predicted transcriptional regulator